MKTSAIKILQSYFNKKNINNLKKIVNAKKLAIGSIVIFIIIILAYLLRPIFFDYELEKQVLKNKIDNHLKLQTNITGDISYYFFPEPRVVVEGLELDFANSKKRPLIIKNSIFYISPFKLQSLKNIEIKKVYIKNQRIKIFPNDFENYLKYFQKENVNNLIVKNCEIYFKDDQDNDITINDFDLRNTFDKKKEKILIKGKFADNKFKINFLNKKNKEKYLNFSIPKLGMNMKIIFDEKSNFNKTSGKLNLKILNNILSLNFNGSKTYNITDSFFRNKFLNSKLDGSINFKKDFYFDLNSQINQINLRKLLLYYGSFIREKSSGQFNISKKINGKLNTKIKSADSFLGKINNTNFNLIFENGDIKIKNGSADINKNSKFKFNISLLGKGNNQKIVFFINFLTNNSKKFLKKFNVNTEEDIMSFNAVGRINITDKKIKFENLVYNKQKLTKKNINIAESLFNENVIAENALGFLDFFNIKKFVNDLFEDQG